MGRTDIDTDEVRRRYANGESVKSLAVEYGAANETILKRLPERRPTGRPARADVDSAEIVRLHDEEGLSLREIASRFGIDKSTAGRRYAAASA